MLIPVSRLHLAQGTQAGGSPSVHISLEIFCTIYVMRGRQKLELPTLETETAQKSRLPLFLTAL